MFDNAKLILNFVNYPANNFSGSIKRIKKEV